MGYGERRYKGNVGQIRKHEPRGINKEEGYTYKGRAGEAVETVKSTVGGAYAYAKEKVEDYQRKKQVREYEEERMAEQNERVKHYSAKDYIIERRIQKAEDEGDTAAEEKLLGIQQKRHEALDDKIYVEKRMKARDNPAGEEPTTFLGKIQKRGREINEETKGGSSSGGMPSSDMFGVGSYGGNADMFNVVGYGAGGSDMFSTVAAKSAPRRIKGRAPRGSQPSGYDGYYDPFGMGGMGGGIDMFNVGGSSTTRSRRKKHHAVGHAMAPADLFAPANVFGIGGTSKGAGNPFGGPQKRSGSDIFGHGSFGGGGNPFGGMGVGNPFAAPSSPRRKTKARKTNKRRR